jgi:hypothetical protein
MTPTTKYMHRASWKNLNFASSTDWAEGWQSFMADDFDIAPDTTPTDNGDVCVSGEDNA